MLLPPTEIDVKTSGTEIRESVLGANGGNSPALVCYSISCAMLFTYAIYNYIKLVVCKTIHKSIIVVGIQCVFMPCEPDLSFMFSLLFGTLL